MASSSRGVSKSQMSFGKILDKISAAAAAAAAAPLDSSGKPAEGKQDEKVEKRGLLDIDLNVVPPEDDGSESPKNGEQIRPKAVAAVAAEEKVISCDGNELNFNGISDEVCRGKSESGNGIQTHLSKGEINGFGLLEEQAQRTESEEETEEKQRRNRRWNALLEVAENALRDYEENHGNKEEKVQNRIRKHREIELGGNGGGLSKETTRNKVAAHRGQSSAEEWNGDGDVVAAAAAEEEEDTVAPPLVVRSTRGRAVAMPNKYRDSVLDGGAVAEAEFHRHNRSGKSATVASTKRKSR